MITGDRESIEMKKSRAVWLVALLMIVLPMSCIAGKIGANAVMAEIKFYEKFEPATFNESEAVSTLFNRGTQIEFELDPKKIGAWAIKRMTQHDTDDVGGYILEMTDGQYKNKEWYYLPLAFEGKEVGGNLAVFNSEYSFRIKAYRVIGNQASNCLAFNFEVEGHGPWAIDSMNDTSGDEKSRPKYPIVMSIPGIKPCTERFCGYKTETAVRCPYVPAGEFFPQTTAVW